MLKTHSEHLRRPLWCLYLLTCKGFHGLWAAGRFCRTDSGGGTGDPGGVTCLHFKKSEKGARAPARGDERPRTELESRTRLPDSANGPVLKAKGRAQPGHWKWGGGCTVLSRSWGLWGWGAGEGFPIEDTRLALPGLLSG